MAGPPQLAAVAAELPASRCCLSPRLPRQLPADAKLPTLPGDQGRRHDGRNAEKRQRLRPSPRLQAL